MNKIWMIASCLVVLIGCASQEASRIEPLVGVVSTEQLFTSFPQFLAEYNAYMPSDQELVAIQKLSGKSILVMFGTWCHDSQREIPRLLKVLDMSKVPLSKFTMHSLNDQKQATNGLHRTYKIRYTPTIILLDGDTELGRVVEKPNNSLGENLAQFVGAGKGVKI